ncbi:ABC transporter substrate-binding protein [Pseudoduganella violaceinigra]|uniref:ABC transporter substrate-binding protein n=1 Tax=Pseudoduganella violaceinigra TaxID=246602 RepID=UPI000425602D|nr:ABC transporter substrate-binding protein [Pseudoduganella violaceinigra]
MKRLCALAAAITLALAAPAAPAADKVLHAFLSTGETGLDPAVASDLASLSLLENLFEPMLRYDYDARPVKLVPGGLRELPSSDASGKVWTFRLRPGMYFSDDPAFNGKKREVVAGDYQYAIERLLDPALKSPWSFLFDGKLAELRVLDRYTLRMTLKEPDPSLLFYLALPATGAVAREVADAYGSQVGNHPVGSGPFVIEQWKRSDKITLAANRGYHQVWQGRQLPMVDKVEVKIMEEYQSRVLGFLNGEFDFIEQVPESMRDMVLDPSSPAPVLKQELAGRGMVLSAFPVLQTYYMWMNMDDPVLGGYSKEKVALRRAIALGYNGPEDIALLKKGLAIPAQSPLPPNVLGYDPAYRSPLSYNPKLAKALLDRFGYKVGKDGFRSQPNGQPLALLMHSEPTMVGRLRDELWRKNLNAIGIRVRFKTDKKTEIIKASRLGKVQMFETNWVADFPDGENFYQLLYGPNSGRANYARFNLPAYNSRYEKARQLGDGPQRDTLYREMNQLIHAYNPWVLLIHPISADIQQPWLKHYKRHPVEFTNWRYLDVER